MNSKVILQPATSFSQIERRLHALDWVKLPDTSVAPSLIPGEPEFASWSKREGDGRISYTFNPVVRLRVLVFYGELADLASAETARSLPVLRIEDVRELLTSADPRTLLLGIFAARELAALETIDLLDKLAGHSHETVAAAAREAHGRMLPLWLQAGAERLRDQKQQHPERSVLFPLLGDAQVRRQTLRWLIHDYQKSNEHIDAVIRSGLDDEDWEVRATSMLAAVRLDARSCSADVKEAQLVPRLGGPDEIDLEILHDAHNVALRQLTKESISDNDDKSESRRHHLWRCMMGQPVERHDRIFLLINGLTQPLEIEDDVPPAFDYIEEEDGRYSLRHTGIELCWVAALPHWLGADDSDLMVPNPIRRVVRSKGFFIARRPLSIAQARRLRSSAAASDVHTTEDDELCLCDQVEAVRLCELLGRLEGAQIDLPEADEWEMAARGTDGRRYPWGNGVEPDPKTLLSPWGLEQTVCYRSQWTTNNTEANVGIVCGGENDFRCFSRREVALNSAASLFGVRPVVRSGST